MLMSCFLIIQGCSTFIQSIARDGEQVGIVVFAATARENAPLTVISNTTRQELLDALPPNANGGTSIGAGMNILERRGEEPGIEYLLPLSKYQM